MSWQELLEIHQVKQENPDLCVTTSGPATGVSQTFEELDPGLVSGLVNTVRAYKNSKQ